MSSLTMRSALSIRFGDLSASGFVFRAICGSLFSACCCCCCFCGSGAGCSGGAPALACSVVSPRDGFGCASGRAPSLMTSSGPITGGGGCGGGGGGGGGGG